MDNDVIDAMSIDVEEEINGIDNSSSNLNQDTFESEEDRGNENDEGYDLTSEILRLRGIEDSNKIQFVDESGAVIERSWDNLSKNEQLNIILHGGDDPDTDVDDSEIELLNAIRLSNLSPKEYINQIVENALKENQPDQIYKIDELSDDDLVAMDLMTKVGRENITDDEIQEYVDNAKQNDSLYQKTVQSLREYYKNLEDDNISREQEEAANKSKQEYEQFSNTILNLILGLNNFAGQPIQLDRNDMENLASFMLDRDESGMSEFAKMMNNPALFTQAAFWMLNANNIMSEFKRLKQEAYTRGFNMGKGNFGKNPVVFKPKDQSTQSKSQSTDAFAMIDTENYLD